MIKIKNEEQITAILQRSEKALWKIIYDLENAKSLIDDDEPDLAEAEFQYNRIYNALIGLYDAARELDKKRVDL